MMRKLDRRGVAALEFCLVAAPMFILMFVIFDLGRYAITMQSLRAVANAGARAVMISPCFTNAVIQNQSPSACGVPASFNPQNVAPFLYAGGLTPTVSASTGASPKTVTASQASFTALMPIWGTALNAPSASASVPF
jgi:Flp pilus assembly protein TadG